MPGLNLFTITWQAMPVHVFHHAIALERHEGHALLSGSYHIVSSRDLSVVAGVCGPPLVVFSVHTGHPSVHKVLECRDAQHWKGLRVQACVSTARHHLCAE
jgi:hypothetical protein